MGPILLFLVIVAHCIFASSGQFSSAETRILLIGGYVSIGSIEVYYPQNPSKNKQLTDVKLLTPRSQHVSVLMTDGKVLTTGGASGTTNRLPTELLDLKTRQVSSAPPLQTERRAPGAVALGGEVYVCGGEGEKAPLKTCEKFESGKWHSAPSLNLARSAPSFVVLGNHIYAIGGYNGKKALTSVECFDPKTSKWTPEKAMNQARAFAAAAVLDGYVYVCGGDDGEGTFLSSCEMFSPATKQWKAVASLNHPRVAFQLATLSGRLYAVEGFTGAKTTESADRQVEEYDPKNNHWKVLSTKIITKRWYASAIAL